MRKSRKNLLAEDARPDKVPVIYRSSFSALAEAENAIKSGKADDIWDAIRSFLGIISPPNTTPIGAHPMHHLYLLHPVLIMCDRLASLQEYTTEAIRLTEHAGELTEPRSSERLQAQVNWRKQVTQLGQNDINKALRFAREAAFQEGGVFTMTALAVWHALLTEKAESDVLETMREARTTFSSFARPGSALERLAIDFYLDHVDAAILINRASVLEGLRRANQLFSDNPVLKDRIAAKIEQHTEQPKFTKRRHDAIRAAEVFKAAYG